MCGIVGYIGQKGAAGILVNGLRSLEYRGYDSAGIALSSGSGTFNIVRASGKLVNLAAKVDLSDPTPLGIGHTLYNAALRHTHATTANLIATQEVTLGILLGALVLGEMPQINEIAGALVTLLGIVLVLL